MSSTFLLLLPGRLVSLFSVVVGCAVSRFLGLIPQAGVVSAGGATVAYAAAENRLGLSWWVAWLLLLLNYSRCNPEDKVAAIEIISYVR